MEDIMQFNININNLSTLKSLNIINRTLFLSTIAICSLLSSACATKHATSYPPFTPELIGKNSAGIKYTPKTSTKPN
jgi:hypothetical protein